MNNHSTRRTFISQATAMAAASSVVLASDSPAVHAGEDSTIGDRHLSSDRPSTGPTVVKWIDRKKIHSELLTGTFLNLGSATAVEIAADLGFDWLLVDLEHGSGTFADLRPMLLACRGSLACPIIRIPSVNADTVKFVMDSGATGIMFPFVSSAAEAERAVRFIKYPPTGHRGVAGSIRATSYGRDWKTYFKEANDNSLVVVQIETAAAVDAADEIAAVAGVDVLFVGPLDLSVSLGCPGDFSPPYYIEALKKVTAACQRHGKTAGILTRPELVQQHKELGASSKITSRFGACDFGVIANR